MFKVYFDSQAYWGHGYGSRRAYRRAYKRIKYNPFLRFATQAEMDEHEEKMSIKSRIDMAYQRRTGKFKKGKYEILKCSRCGNESRRLEKKCDGCNVKFKIKNREKRLREKDIDRNPVFKTIEELEETKCN